MFVPSLGISNFYAGRTRCKPRPASASALLASSPRSPDGLAARSERTSANGMALPRRSQGFNALKIPKIVFRTTRKPKRIWLESMHGPGMLQVSLGTGLI